METRRRHRQCVEIVGAALRGRPCAIISLIRTHPKARCPGTDFKLTSLTATEAIFENPAHDFPKRIIYRKTGEDGLTASIDGGEGTKSMAFSTKRMK